jgi:hypothetical protein
MLTSLTCGHNKIELYFYFYIFPIGLLALFLIRNIKSVGQRLFSLKEDPTGIFFVPRKYTVEEVTPNCYKVLEVLLLIFLEAREAITYYLFSYYKL